MNSNSPDKNILTPTITNWGTFNWASIIASLVFIYALSWVVFVFSSAIGMTVLDVPEINSYDNSEKASTISYVLYGWYIAWAFVIYFLGGIVVGKYAGKIYHRTGTSHGLIMWSSTIVIAVVLASMGVSSLFSSAAGAIKTTATVGMNLPNAVSSDKESTSIQLPPSIQPLIGAIKKNIKGSSQGEELQKVSEQLNSQTLSSIAIALIQGNEKHAKELITSNTSLEEKEVEELINSLKKQSQKIGEDIRRQADEAREYTAGILWLMLISYLVALIASIFGARYGVNKFAASINEYSK
ncbi:hypothetical protein [Nitrosomonas ureae]|uniref:Uncharacterized protein n=1 Tax=Nitrosomonas ureae TaxID=44577 RepID=A0A286AM36_9PROT|nr:hypothetical protein [Nitrosomonas ureae]SOD22961.1 hypothetical protein SAMN06297164_3629 [Nitrosomonas ureae]